MCKEILCDNKFMLNYVQGHLRSTLNCNTIKGVTESIEALIKKIEEYLKEQK